jgi:hypothetical protein
MNNNLDGIKWEEAELIEVFRLYQTDKFKIHEHNVNIQKLAISLNRKTRAVENQLLMFRAYERQKESNKYGFHNYSKLIPKIFELMTKNPINTDTFPEKFTNFNKTKNGSVRRDGEKNSGRPLDELFKTPLHDFIDKTIQEHYINLDANGISKTILIFIGGAGNGKTDALSYTTELIFSKADVVNIEKTQYENKIRENLILNNGFSSSVFISKTQISIYSIQDASSRLLTDNNNIISIENLIDSFKKEKNGILTICMNRGVLLDIIKKTTNLENKKIFQQINEANSIEAYFSDQTENFNVQIGENYISSYSLDKSSLFDTSSIVNKINSNIKSQPWTSEKKSDVYNNKCFDNEKVNGLNSLLLAYEVYYNAKITFRELYHLYYELFNSSLSSYKNEFLRTYFCRLFLQDTKIKDPFELRKLKSEFTEENSKLFNHQLQQYENLYNEIISAQKEVQKDSLILKLQLFNPNKSSQLIDTEELYPLIGNLRDTKPGEKFTLFDIDKNEIKVDESFVNIISPLIELYHGFEDLKFTTKQNIIESYKSTLLKLIRDVFCAYIYNENGHFKYRNSLKKYQEIGISNYTDIEKQLREILGIHKNKPELNLQLNKELSEYNPSNKINVSIKINLKQVLKFKNLNIKNRPKINYKIFESITKDDVPILLFLDFKNYLEIQKATKINHPNIKLSAASLNSDFKIWINNEIEKFSSIDFSENNEFDIDNIGNFYFDTNTDKYILTQTK